MPVVNVGGRNELVIAISQYPDPVYQRVTTIARGPRGLILREYENHDGDMQLVEEDPHITRADSRFYEDRLGERGL